MTQTNRFVRQWSLWSTYCVLRSTRIGKGVLMRSLLRDSAHLVRPALVILACLGIFLVVRGAIIPKGFGQYGHYRPGALNLVRQHPIAFAGQDACILCHDDEAKARAAGKHAHVACEACHGALAQARGRPRGACSETARSRQPLPALS